MQERITINKREETYINGRRGEDKITPFYSCWADILDLMGQELYQAMGIDLENTLVFKVRYCKKLQDLREKDKFLINWRGRDYKLFYVDYLGNNKKYIKLKCIEVT